MAKINWIVGLLLTGLAGLSCYTSLRHPAIAEDAENPSEYEQASTDASCGSCHHAGGYHNASIPAMRRDHYSWQYFYNSAWWQDEYRAGGEASRMAPEPTDFRRRYPNEDHDPGAGASSVAAPTRVAPSSLGKKSGDAEPSAQDTSNAKDPRRDFDRRGESQKSGSDSRNQVERQPKK